MLPETLRVKPRRPPKATLRSRRPLQHRRQIRTPHLKPRHRRLPPDLQPQRPVHPMRPSKARHRCRRPLQPPLRRIKPSPPSHLEAARGSRCRGSGLLGRPAIRHRPELPRTRCPQALEVLLPADPRAPVRQWQEDRDPCLLTGVRMEVLP